MVDCIIIGSGVAGISAALTLKANGKEFLLFGSPDLSEKIEKAESIQNYPGFLGGSGKALVADLKTQLRREGIEVTDEKVTGAYALKDKFSIITQTGKSFESRTVILACGVELVKQIEGEEAFMGRGVSYCATCDGFLYKGKTVLAFCTSKRLEHEIAHLAHFAKKVYAVPMYKDCEIEGENIQIIRKMPLAILGEKRVEKVAFSAPPAPDLSKEIIVDGVFMLRDSVLPSVLVGGLETEEGFARVDRNMATNLAGCYAAGDCAGRPFQYAKAAGEGNIAAHSVSDFLAKNKA